MKTFWYTYDDEEIEYTPSNDELIMGLATVMSDIYFKDFESSLKLKVSNRIEKMLKDMDNVDELVEIYEDDLKEYFEIDAKEQADNWYHEMKQLYYGY